MCILQCSMRENIVKETHQGGLGGHFRVYKTLEQFNRHYYWPKMQSDIKKFMEQYQIYQREKGKSSNNGLYQPLTIPQRPWECLSMDFVLGSPKTTRGNNTIFVVVDHFNKITHFIPCKQTNDASQIVGLFFRDIMRIHGFPLNIVSDRDSKFLGHFQRTLWKKLGKNLSFSSAYHP